LKVFESAFSARLRGSKYPNGSVIPGRPLAYYTASLRAVDLWLTELGAKAPAAGAEPKRARRVAVNFMV
jgi:hypothetical protein